MSNLSGGQKASIVRNRQANDIACVALKQVLLSTVDIFNHYRTSQSINKVLAVRMNMETIPNRTFTGNNKNSWNIRPLNPMTPLRFI